MAKDGGSKKTVTQPEGFTRSPGSASVQYGTDDINDYIELTINEELGGFRAIGKEKCHYLLASEKNGLVAVTPTIDTASSGYPIDYYLDKDKQPTNPLATALNKLIPRLKELTTIPEGQKSVSDKRLEARIERYILPDKLDSQALKLVIKYLKEAKFQKQDIEKQIIEMEARRQRLDVFDEIMPELIRNYGNDARIVFPYNITNNHWLVGEIRIYRIDNDYMVDIYAHDPYGGGRMSAKNAEDIEAAIRKRITAYHKGAGLPAPEFVQFDYPKSPYTQRQAKGDGVSCGVITAEDIILRIQGQPLTGDSGKPYTHNALALRKQHAEKFKSYRSDTDITRRNFIARYEAAISSFEGRITNELSSKDKAEIIKLIHSMENRNLKTGILDAINSDSKDRDLYVSSLQSAIESYPQRLLSNGKKLSENDINAINKLNKMLFDKHGLIKGNPTLIKQLQSVKGKQGIETDPKYRRFESIAWLIQGRSKVAAACFDGEYLVLGANNIKETDKEGIVDRIASDEATQKHEEWVYKVVDYLRLVAEQGAYLIKHQNDEDIEEIYKTSRRLISDETEALLKLAPKEGYKARGDFDRLVDSLHKTTNSILASYLSPDDDRAFPVEFCKALEDNRIDYAFRERELQGVHAEQQVLQRLFDNKKLMGKKGEQYYIGISRKCCLLCEHLIEAVNEEIGDRSIFETILVRDVGHGARYPAGVPPFLSELSKLDSALKANIIETFKRKLKQDVRISSELEELLNKSNVTVLKIFTHPIPAKQVKQQHKRSSSREVEPFRVSSKWIKEIIAKRKQKKESSMDIGAKEVVKHKKHKSSKNKSSSPSGKGLNDNHSSGKKKKKRKRSRSKSHLKRYEKSTTMDSNNWEGYNFGDKLSESVGQYQVGYQRFNSKIQAAEDYQALLRLPTTTKVGVVKLRPEDNHSTDHPSNINAMIKGIENGKIPPGTVICLERKQKGSNLGMADVIMLAQILKLKESNPARLVTIPKWLKDSPIYQDAQLYNVAKANGIAVVGIEGKGLKYTAEFIIGNHKSAQQELAQLRKEHQGIISQLATTDTPELQKKVKVLNEQIDKQQKRVQSIADLVGQIPGIIGKDIDKNSVLYNAAREKAMLNKLEQIASTGRQVIFPVGAEHIESLEAQLKLKGIQAEVGKAETIVVSPLLSGKPEAPSIPAVLSSVAKSVIRPEVAKKAAPIEALLQPKQLQDSSLLKKESAGKQTHTTMSAITKQSSQTTPKSFVDRIKQPTKPGDFVDRLKPSQEKSDSHLHGK